MVNLLKKMIIGIFTLILGGNVFDSDVFAQLQTILPTGPIHPLVDYGPIRIETGIDTIHFFTSYEGGREVFQPTTQIIARSEDNLTDTVTILSGLLRHDIYRYNEKNQLLYQHEFHPRHPLQWYVREDYEYNEDGRMIKLTVKEIKPGETPSEEILNVYTYDYSTIRMTEKGYIFGYSFDEKGDMEFETDELGRLIHAKYVNGMDEYVEYTDGKKYLIGAAYYSYTDSSWTSFGYSQPDIMVPGMPDMWVEITYVFDENKNVKQRTSMVSTDGINWNLSGKMETEYVYSGDSGNRTSNSAVDNTTTVVYAHSGAIHIFTENAGLVQIFDLFGRLIKQQAVTPGENRISVPVGGFYIVRVDSESFKVFVR